MTTHNIQYPFEIQRLFELTYYHASNYVMIQLVYYKCVYLCMYHVSHESMGNPAACPQATIIIIIIIQS